MFLLNSCLHHQVSLGGSLLSAATFLHNIGPLTDLSWAFLPKLKSRENSPGQSPLSSGWSHELGSEFVIVSFIAPAWKSDWRDQQLLPKHQFLPFQSFSSLLWTQLFLEIDRLQWDHAVKEKELHYIYIYVCIFKSESLYFKQWWQPGVISPVLAPVMQSCPSSPASLCAAPSPTESQCNLGWEESKEVACSNPAQGRDKTLKSTKRNPLFPISSSS